jgi:hypothetical protein
MSIQDYNNAKNMPVSEHECDCDCELCIELLAEFSLED